MNEYMNEVSQRSDGCLALDGGHMCPFLSDGAAEVIGMRNRATKRDGSGGEGGWTRETDV